MNEVTTYFTGGGFVIMLVVYVVKTFLDSAKDKEKRLNENDVRDALQNQDIIHQKELNRLKHEHHDYRIKQLEDKKCKCNEKN